MPRKSMRRQAGAANSIRRWSRCSAKRGIKFTTFEIHIPASPASRGPRSTRPSRRGARSNSSPASTRQLRGKVSGGISTRWIGLILACWSCLVTAARTWSWLLRRPRQALNHPALQSGFRAELMYRLADTLVADISELLAALE